MKKHLFDKPLEYTIKHAAQEYYEGNPIMSDDKFDELVDTLRERDPQNELLRKVGWGLDVNKSKNLKRTHNYGVVGSLDKVHHISEITFDEWMTTPKLDGSTCVAHYENGVFQYATTRGDGTIGIDRTEHYKFITAKYDIEVPHDFTGDIRGEIEFTMENWEKYKELYPDAKLPRNVSTGLFMRDDITDELNLVSFIPYKIHGTTQSHFWRYAQVLQFLKDCGFPQIPVAHLCNHERVLLNLEELFTTWGKIYPIDGLVLNNGITWHENTGFIEYNDIAFKFPAEDKIATVTDVVWELSRNNTMIPVINIEPTILSGALVSRCTGFNYKFIKDNVIGPGAQIKIMRSGEVIPHCMEVITPAIAPKVPTVCPVCGQSLVQDGVHLKCINSECDNIKFSQLYRWLEVIGVRDLLGVGPALLTQIIENLNKQGITTVEQLYTNDISYVENVLTPANRSKYRQMQINLRQPVTTAQVITAANIMGLGDTHANNLGDLIYTHIDEPEVLTQELLKINGIGQFVVKCVLNARFRLKRLFALLTVQKSVVGANNDVKMQITVTGSLSIPRKQFEAKCLSKGVLVSDNIKSSKYLVTNNSDPTSSKGKKAKQLSIPIITEEQFNQILESL